MNSKFAGGRLDAIANESIVIVDENGNKRRQRRPLLSSLDSAMIFKSNRRLSHKPEQSLYPDVSKLPPIMTADEVWAATASKRPSSEASDKHTNQVSSSDTNNDNESCSSVESQSFQRKTVQVTPGVFVPLRGSEETLLALENGQVTSVTCIFCNVDLVVHAAASMIICPDCEMISPLGVENGDGGETSLGLGLKRKSLELSSTKSHFKDDSELEDAESMLVETLKDWNLKRGDPDDDSSLSY